MKRALLLAALLPGLSWAASFEETRPLEAASPTPTAAQVLALPSLPPALALALPSVPVETVAAVQATKPAAQAALAQTAARVQKSPAAAPAQIAQLYDGVGARPALALAGGFSDPVRAPTPAQARKLLVMKRLADAFLLKKGLWFPHKMSPVSPANPGGLRGILVGDLKDSVAKYGDGIVVVNAKHVDRVLPARLADAMLHEIIHHLHPSLGGDEMLSHMYEAEFSVFMNTWLAEANLGYDLKPKTRLSSLADVWRWGETFYRMSQSSLRSAYENGSLLRQIASYYTKTGWKDNPLGFTGGSAGARRLRAMLAEKLAKNEAELATATDPEARERLERLRRNGVRGLDAYDRLVIPALERYERISGWRPDPVPAKGAALPK